MRLQLNKHVIDIEIFNYFANGVYKDLTNNWIREAIGLSLLKINGYHGDIITDMYEQLHYGDCFVTNLGTDYYFIDIKHSYNSYCWCDISYWCDKNKQNEYIQRNTNNNLGWLYNLDMCDCLLLIDNSEQFFYVIDNWQVVRQRLLYLANCSNSTFIMPKCIDRLVTYDKLCNKYTDSFKLQLNSQLEHYLRCNYYNG